jgi:mannitol/fructose-specific phosphotransferase system IIA component
MKTYKIKGFDVKVEIDGEPDQIEAATQHINQAGWVLEEDVPSLLTEDELETLVLGALKARPHTEESLHSLIDWATDTRTSQILLEMALGGAISVHWDDEAQDIAATVIDEA